MCVADWRFGRFIRPQVTRFSPLAGNQTFQANAQRVGISISLRSDLLVAADVQVGINILGFEAFNLTTYDSYRHITLATHGDLPTRLFVLSPSQGSGTVAVVEYFLPETVLNEVMERLQREYNSLKG